MPKVTKASHHAKKTVVKLENKENDVIKLSDGSDDDHVLSVRNGSPAHPVLHPLHDTICSVVYPPDKLNPIIFQFSGPVEPVKVHMLLLV